MFYQVRYQTGELESVVSEMKNRNIPCMDVDNMDEFNWVVNKLSEYGIFRNPNIPLDKNARNRVKEPEFEFRASFSQTKDTSDKDKLMYIDFYFEPYIEKDYDPIFGD